MTSDQLGRVSSLVTVTWYGQAGFRLASGDARVLIDPFLSDHHARHYPPPASAAEFADITLVLCTHEHLDPAACPGHRAGASLSA